ncbi:unnamed protein product [Lymnaea stagnalis]|uniref:Death domain-containing protein n=1 Tax=Lymnaea stagnalis TaxID=6523 RepID=A0AAV2IK55_LYMST
MPSETKGHGGSTNHGHGHKSPPDVDSSSSNKKAGKAQTKKTKPKDKRVISKPEDDRTSVASNDSAGDQSRDEPAKEKTRNEIAVDANVNGRDFNQDNEHETKPSEKRDFKKSNVTPANFNVREFNTNMSEFIKTLDDPRYSQVDGEYPVGELVSVVQMVTKSVNDYRTHTSDTQSQLEHLRDAMKTIREHLHFSVTRQAMDLRTDDEHQSQEVRDLKVKLAELNAALAQANADVTEALKLAAETQSTAIKANIAAEKAREETRRIQEEVETREKAEQRRKEEEKRRQVEQKRLKEEEAKRVRERMEETGSPAVGEKQSALRELVTCSVSTSPGSNRGFSGHTNEDGETEVTCIARGHPGSFDQQNLTARVAVDLESTVTYLPHEELISHVVDLTSHNGTDELKSPVYVAIPHVLSRTGAQSREAVVKAMVKGEWKDLPTRDVTFDTHKDTKFAQAEVRHLTTLIVMSRFKRDYVTLAPNKSQKVTSSFDQRITLTIDRDTLVKKEHFLLQVQPVDSATVQDFRTRQPNGKSLLASSAFVYTQWEVTSFKKPIQVTLPCPPNPAKAKKMALARKLKEEKMKNPAKPPLPIEEQEKEKEKEKKRMQEYVEPSSDSSPAKVSKWYMGDYANTDDDETDNLHFVYMQAGRWCIQPDMAIKQVKVDVVSFSLDFPVERFIVLRTRTTTNDDAIMSMVISLNEYLGKRFVEAVVRQKTENPYEVALQVTPVSRLDAVVKQLAQHGFESGPAPSHVICLHEGDIIEVGFSGNIECKDEIPSHLIYKSNVPTVTFFTVKEENKFRQKEHDVYSGLICLTRKYLQPSQKGKKGQGQDDSDQKEWKQERLCALQINIPKYHITPSTEPVKAPVVIPETDGPVDRELLMTIAEQLGDEWKKVAHYLGVHRARVQAIARNVAVGERSDREAKYDMLVTWIKGAAKALDKVSALSSALTNSDRNDLAETVRDRGREVTELRHGQLTAVR